MKKLFLICALLIGAITNGHSQHTSDSTIKKASTLKRTGVKKPLYVIDGVKQINPGSIANGLPPDSIAEMTILSKEDAIKLFGIEAIDGAIVIKTKSKKNQTNRLNLKEKDNSLEKRNDIYNPTNSKNYNSTSEKGTAITSLNNKPNIILRGLGNQSSPNYKDATYILDGQKIEKEALSWLNPNTIQSVSILKRDNAVAQYGPQAYNGVIIINTKPAKKTENPDKPVDKN